MTKLIKRMIYMLMFVALSMTVVNKVVMSGFTQMNNQIAEKQTKKSPAIPGQNKSLKECMKGKKVINEDTLRCQKSY